MKILQIISHSFLTSSLRTNGSLVSTFGSINNSRKAFPFSSRSKASLSTMSAIEILSTATVTPKGGLLHRCKHKSTSTKTDMIFAIFLPSVYSVAAVSTDANAAANFPAVYWLSGLTCTDENFCKKAGPQAFAAAEEDGVCIVVPDTSPRGDDIPSDDAHDLGTGAGFFIDATNPPWDVNYHMETYISSEPPALAKPPCGDRPEAALSLR